MRRKRSKISASDTGPVELNVMPFIDVFSLLTTFLLFSAVFIQIGIIEVQAPFFSNKPQKDEGKNKRLISVHVTLEQNKIEVETFFDIPPRNAKSEDFALDEAGIQEMHDHLVEIRQENPDTDKLTLFVDDEISYDNVVKVVDAIKILNADDPPIPQSGSSETKSTASHQTNRYLYPKVVMGNVLL